MVADVADLQRWPDRGVLSEFGDPLEDAPFFLLLEGYVSVQIPLPRRAGANRGQCGNSGKPVWHGRAVPA